MGGFCPVPMIHILLFTGRYFTVKHGGYIGMCQYFTLKHGGYIGMYFCNYHG